MSDTASGKLPATWVDGQQARAHEVLLERDGAHLRATLADGRVFARDATALEPLTDAAAPRPVFADAHGGQLILHRAADGVALLAPAGAAARRAAPVPSRRYAAAAALGILTSLATLVAWVVPKAAEVAASVLPWRIEVTLGHDVLRQLDGSVLKPTALAAPTRAQIEGRFKAMAELAGMPDAQLVFRSGLGPNAFALPGRAVVVTDELVALLGPSPRIDAVLAHELGHLRHRHAARAILRRGGFALLVGALLHDDPLAAKAIRGAPLDVLVAAHSRDAEREADAFARELLPRMGVAPAALGDALEAMERKLGRDPGRASYLATHPGSRERIDAAREAR